MKKFIYSILACAALFFVGCQTPEVEQVVTADMVELAIEASSTDIDETRLSLNGNTTKWEVGDRITVAFISGTNKASYANFEIKSSSDISQDGKAIFRGSAPAGSYYAISAIYPGVDNGSNSVTLDRTSKNNVFMSSHRAESITIDNNTKSLPLDFSHLMHKLDVNLSLASGYTSDDLSATDIRVEMTAKSNGTPINFWQTASYNTTTNSLSQQSSTNVISLATSGKTSAKSLSLSTLIFSLGTQRNVAFTFTVYINNNKCYVIEKPEDGTLTTFAMSGGKTTVVNLELSQHNNVSGGSEQKAITLNASKTTIKANGSDSVQLTVVTDDDNKDVTSESTIYVNGAKLNGTSFSTTEAGSYTLYAMRNEVRSNEITITAEKVATGKTIVFAEGVTLTSGWYDVNKMAKGDNGDINMCWAAASSNMIQWWQDRYVAAGKQLPSKAINGRGTKMHSGDTFNRTYELALMDMFREEWDNSRGCSSTEGIPWYFEGVNLGEMASAGSQAVPLTDGGYWKDIWSTIKPMLYCEYDYMFKMYKDLYTAQYVSFGGWASEWDYQPVKKGEEALAAFSKCVVDFIDRGIASMTISLNSNGGLLHATTLWGYEIDNETGYVTRIWITDSDDLETEPKQELLNEYNVSAIDGDHKIAITSESVRYRKAYVTQLLPLSGYGSANK